MLEKWDYDYAINKISKEVAASYEEKIANISKETNNQVDYHQVERNELLRAVDKNWIDHIDAMDQLRKGIGLRGYAQQDPVIAYKQEGHDMFEEMIERIQTTTISRLLKGKIIKVTPNTHMPLPGVTGMPARPLPGVSGPAAQPMPGVQRKTINIPLDTLPKPKPINEEGDFVPKGTIIHRPRTEAANNEAATKDVANNEASKEPQTTDTENKDTDNTNK
jgi:preprotein translocase subunit SecA